MDWIEDLYNKAIQNNGYAQSAEVVYGRGNYNDSRVVSSCTVLLSENYQLWYREVYSENDHAQCGYDLGFERYYKMYADLFTMPFELGKKKIKHFEGNGGFDFNSLPSEMIEKHGEELKYFKCLSEKFVKQKKYQKDCLDYEISQLKNKTKFAAFRELKPSEIEFNAILDLKVALLLKKRRKHTIK